MLTMSEEIIIQRTVVPADEENMNTTAWTEDSREAAEAAEDDDRTYSLWFAGCLLFVFLVFALSTCQYFRKRRNTPAAKKKRKLLNEKQNKALEEKRIREVSFQPIPVEAFLDSLAKKKKGGLICIEYKAVACHDEEFSQAVGSYKSNDSKNSHSVIPFDHSRVFLDPLPGMPDSDYINASYVDGYNKPKAYIAAMGPNSSTVADFWRMIWQENPPCIVMLTNVFDYSKQQCEKYWHTTYNLYGNIHVRLEQSESTCNYTCRTFWISKVGFPQERKILQFQFHTWDEWELPDTHAVLHFRRKVKTYTRKLTGPIVLHCGDGSGRTGTYLALDFILDKMLAEGVVDILGTVKAMRKARPKVVTNMSQFQLLFESIYLSLLSGVTVVKAGELEEVAEKMKQKDPGSSNNGFEHEFKTLTAVSPKLSVGDCAGGHRVENRKKSRDIMIQPPERARPYLMTFDSTDSADYINAVYVNGYYQTNEYIVTQWPLKNTTNDIWRLVYDCRVRTVAVLHDQSTSRSYPEFWPKKVGEKTRFGPISVTLFSTEAMTSLTVMTFVVKKAMINPADIKDYDSEALSLKMFFLNSWPEPGKSASSMHGLLDLVHSTEGWREAANAKKSHTCVISKNGVSRTGVYCVVATCMDQLRNDGEVDVFNAVRTVKLNRPQLVENLAEYTLCYLVVATVDSNSIDTTRKRTSRGSSDRRASNAPVACARGDNELCIRGSGRQWNVSSTLDRTGGNDFDAMFTHAQGSGYTAQRANISGNTTSLSRKAGGKALIGAFESNGVDMSHLKAGGRPELVWNQGLVRDFPRMHHSADKTSVLAQSGFEMSNGVESFSFDVPIEERRTGGQGESAYTSGRAFLHYALNDLEEVQAGANELAENGREDDQSTLSSFRMDPDIISLENAQLMEERGAPLPPILPAPAPSPPACNNNYMPYVAADQNARSVQSFSSVRR